MPCAASQSLTSSRGAEVRSTVLGPAPSGRLGWDAYLVTGPQADDRGDVRYDVQPL
jgi:type VI secretion system protein ImpH